MSVDLKPLIATVAANSERAWSIAGNYFYCKSIGQPCELQLTGKNLDIRIPIEGGERLGPFSETFNEMRLVNDNGSAGAFVVMFGQGASVQRDPASTTVTGTVTVETGGTALDATESQWNSVYQGNGTVTDASGTVITAYSDSREAVLKNTGFNTMYIAVQRSATTSDYPLVPGETMSFPPSTQRVEAICGTGLSTTYSWIKGRIS